MGLFRDLDLRPVTLSVAPYALRKYGARGVDLASVVFEPPASRRFRDPDRLLPSFNPRLIDSFTWFRRLMD
jgi:hypothetical protein